MLVLHAFTCPLGRAKIYGAPGANSHSFILYKSWLHKKFQTKILNFHLAPRASKLAGLRGHFRCAAGIPLFLHFHSLTSPLAIFFITMTPMEFYSTHLLKFSYA